MQQRQSGFTLVEIAIVLVIIGLLLGGILKGQELITSAKVRNVADQQNSVKAAIYAFQDRFRALPGDYLAAQAQANIPNSTLANGNGDGQISINESALAWHQLAAAGFIGCASCATDIAATPPSSANSPLNAYNGVLVLAYDAAYGDPAPTNRNNFKSGAQIPPNILAEVDRKVDDGNPQTGTMRSTNSAVAGELAVNAGCIVAGPPTAWGLDTGMSCAAASLF